MIASVVLAACLIQLPVSSAARAPLPRTTTVHAVAPLIFNGGGTWESVVWFNAFDTTQGTLDAVTITWHVQGFSYGFVWAEAGPCLPEFQTGTQDFIPGAVRFDNFWGGPYSDVQYPFNNGTYTVIPSQTVIDVTPTPIQLPPLHVTRTYVQGPLTSPAVLNAVSVPVGSVQMPVTRAHYTPNYWSFWGGESCSTSAIWNSGVNLQRGSRANIDVTYHWH
jgi:hypothetical protein